MSIDMQEIYDSLQEIAWHFGSNGVNGECCEDLSFVEYMALKKACEKNVLSVQEVGNVLNFTKSGATKIINRLEDKGYVNRKHSPIDGRVCCITITAKGKDVIDKIVKKHIAYLETAFKDIELQKINQIKDTLQILVKVVQQKEAI